MPYEKCTSILQKGGMSMLTLQEVENFLDAWPNTGLSPEENILIMEFCINSFGDNALLSIGYTKEAVIRLDSERSRETIRKQPASSSICWSL